MNRRVRSAAWIFRVVIATGWPGAAVAANVTSLCGAGERIIFTCGIQSSPRMVSLCRVEGATRDGGYVRYRFGRPGRSELEFSSGSAGTQRKLRYAHYSRLQVTRTEVSFDVNQHTYTVFDSSEGDGDGFERLRGISIVLPDKSRHVLLCGKTAAGSLSEIEHFATCDAKSPLNMGRCPAKQEDTRWPR